MKKLLLFLVFIFLNLRADYLSIGYYMDAVNYTNITFFDKNYRDRCYEDGGKLKIGKDIYLYSQKTPYSHLGSGKTYIPQFEPNCLKDYAIRKCSWDHTPYTPDIAGFWEGNYMYCLKREGYEYSKSQKIWINTETHEILCPEGQRYNSSTEQCENIPQCPSSDELDQQAIQKCGSLDWVQNEFCDPDTGEITITCKSCEEITQMLSDYCSAHDGTLKDGSYSCHQNADGSLNVNFSSDFSVDMCKIPDNNENNNSDNNSSNIGSGSNDNNTTGGGSSGNNPGNAGGSGSNDNNTTGGGSTGNNSGNGSGSTGNNSSNDSNNTCPNPCYLKEHKPIGFQETSYNKNGFLCRKITYPTYDNCFLEYHMDGSTCIQGCDNSSSGSGSSGNNVNVKVNVDTSGIEDKLDSVNQKLDDLKNMTPESNSSQYDGSIITEALDQYSKASDNVKKDFNSIKDKFNELKTLFDSNKKMDLSFTDIGSSEKCFELQIWGKKINFDLCSPLQTLSPILTFVVTLILNIFLIMFAVKHMFKE